MIRDTSPARIPTLPKLSCDSYIGTLTANQEGGTCYVQAANGTAVLPGTVSCSLRLMNCTEDTAILSLSAPDAKYLQGSSGPPSLGQTGGFTFLILRTKEKTIMVGLQTPSKNPGPESLDGCRRRRILTARPHSREAAHARASAIGLQRAQRSAGAVQESYVDAPAHECKRLQGCRQSTRVLRPADGLHHGGCCQCGLRAGQSQLQHDAQQR